MHHLQVVLDPEVSLSSWYPLTPRPILRIRKVKCDEEKPACKRCISTGRTCDGYRSNFRVSVAPDFLALTTTAALVTTLHPTSSSSFSTLSYYQPSGIGILTPTPEHIQWLATHFTIKPPASIGMAYGNGISYEAEARATLSATSEPAIQHALVSIATLRSLFEQAADPSTYSVRANSPEIVRALSEYTHALRTLGYRISSNSILAGRYSLLCCQMFISIELGMDDFTAATQHFIRGMRIMYQCGSRPYYINRANGIQIVPSRSPNMPSVDLFVLKLFMTPCPNGMTDDFIATSDVQFPSVPGKAKQAQVAAVHQANLCLVAHLRSTVHLLHQVSQLSPTFPSPESLIQQRLTLLEHLRDWKSDFMLFMQAEASELTLWARLGLCFSLFCCLCTQSIVTLATRPYGSEILTVEPIFEETLAIARDISAIKREIKAEGESLTGFMAALMEC